MYINLPKLTLSQETVRMLTHAQQGERLCISAPPSCHSLPPACPQVDAVGKQKI